MDAVDLTTSLLQADAAGRDVWVITGAYGFYARLGFVTVAEDSVGGDNPNWDGKPIEVHVVSSATTLDNFTRLTATLGHLRRCVENTRPAQFQPTEVLQEVSRLTVALMYAYG